MRKAIPRPTLSTLVTVVPLALLLAAGAPLLAEEARFSPVLAGINDQLAVEGSEYRIESAEAMTTAGPEFGITLIANNRGNKQLGSHWVAGDPRRGGFTDIAYFIDLFDGATASGLTAAQTTGAIDAAMSTWQDVQCSDIPITRLGAFNIDLGFVEFLLGFGGFPQPLFDLTHAGFLPGAFFDALAPGGSTFILGVTVTLVFVDGNGIPTDIDGNGKTDTGIREIYYNNAFPWFVNGVNNVDVQSVAVHEAGHGLSQAHFGKVFLDNKGNLKFAPKAVMNAVYVGPQRDLLGTDNGGHCSIWAEWPN